jgi:hypothetical protein
MATRAMSASDAMCMTTPCDGRLAMRLRDRIEIETEIEIEIE